MRDFTLRRNACLPHLTILQGNGCSIAKKSGETYTSQLNLQPIYFKYVRLLVSSSFSVILEHIFLSILTSVMVDLKLNCKALEEPLFVMKFLNISLESKVI